jgi:hypothetical protein
MGLLGGMAPSFLVPSSFPLSVCMSKCMRVCIQNHGTESSPTVPWKALSLFTMAVPSRTSSRGTHDGKDSVVSQGGSNSNSAAHWLYDPGGSHTTL